MEQTTCPKCQADNPRTHNFCWNCGHRLVDLCPRCQFPLAGEVNFCGNCGLGLSPQAQFVWGTDGANLTFKPARTPARPAIVEPLPAPPASEETRPQNSLERYIPKELMAKLEVARAHGGMSGERRIVTMLFCDVKGSTSAAGNLDPEEWTEIINGAFEYMIRPVYKYEGTVARLTGDGILAFFGAPIAHEDDPARAVMAGLDIVAGLAPFQEQVQQQWGLEINVRIGINTGLVVVGAVGSDLRMEYTAMGDAINLAARMEQTAKPGTVQISLDTYKLVTPLFDFEDLGGIEVKGKPEPVPAYRVLGRKANAGRTRGIEGLEAALVGRGEELERLQQVIANLKLGIGHIVCLLGGAGLGKSRLIAELRRSLAKDPALEWHEVASLSYEASYPYALFQQLIRRMAGIAAAEETGSFWDKVSQLTGAIPDGDEARYARVLAALFGMPAPSGQPPLEGEAFKRELYGLMSQLWQARFADRPAVLVLDDLHWADPASIELLLHLLTSVETKPLVLLCAFRPDREAPSYRLKHAADEEFPHRYSEIVLSPLSAAESDELVDRLLTIAELPDSLRARIQERAGGNPFYVEEVVRTLIEKGALVAEDRSEDGTVRRYWRATSDGATIDIPENLQGLLTARIDRLEEDTRRVVQLASVIGRSFYHRVLCEIGRMEKFAPEEVEDQIGRLVRLEMIQETARLPDIEYRFRNPMTQQIAYQTILLKRRREFHRRVGAALETLFPERLAELAPRLAFHYSEGRQADKALALYTLAGDQAFRLFALEEALGNYDQALKWAKEGGASSKQLVHLYQRRGRVLELLLRHGEAMETFLALEALGEERDDDALRLAGLVAQSIAFTVTTFEFEKSLEYTNRAVELARELGDRYNEARGLWGRMLAFTWYDGQQALVAGQQALAVTRELVAGPETTQEHLDLLALILMDLTIPLIGNGHVDTAAGYAAEARAMFEEFGNLPMAATSAQRQGLAYRVKGQYGKAQEVYAEAVEIDRSIGNDGGLIGSTLGLFDIYPMVGDFGAQLEMIERNRSIMLREQRVPPQVFDMQAIAVYFHLGLYDRMLDHADAVISFKAANSPVWPDIFVCILTRAYIGSGDLEAAQNSLALISPDLDLNNYMMPVTPLVRQTRAELALALGNWQEARAIVEPFVKKIREDGVFGYLPEKLLLLADSLCVGGQMDAAYAALNEAYSLASEQGTMPLLWRICAQLAGMEEERGNHARANSIYGDARVAINFIAEHAGGDDLRTEFLGLPEVRSILEKTGEPT